MSEVTPTTRVLSSEDRREPFPLYVVWETTMRCDQACNHCGTRAGKGDPNELTTEQAFEVCDALARLGAREVTLIGGEAYLRDDCLALIERLAGHGVRVSMQTGGRKFGLERAQALRDAGLSGLGVSVDGPAIAHDRIRGNLGSYTAAMRALKNGAKVGLALSANTQVNRLTMNRLWETAEALMDVGVEAWQVQLTGPLGRAADRPDWLCQPWHIVPVIETLAEIQTTAIERWKQSGKKARPFNVVANNNIGYFGPHEVLLRSNPFGVETHWRGCMAGSYVLGIESDGLIKACPTLPTEAYGAGNIKDMSLEDVWQRSEVLRFARDRGTEELWGFCKSCYYADVCKAGCSWTAHTFMGRRGNMPICYHRVVQLRRKGIRERLVRVQRAPGQPYDHGRFEIVEEPWPDDNASGAAQGQS